MRARSTIFALAGLALAGAFGAAFAQSPGTTGGVYSAAQAAEGATLFAANCAMCHGQTLEGTFETPGLKGKFVADWSRSTAGALFDYVSRAMPQHAPGSLSPDDNARIVAFLLRENGMPAGARPLPADPETLKTVAIFPAPTSH